MKLRDVEGWPPQLIDSQTFKVAPSHAVPARFKRCGVYSIAGSPLPYLSIVVHYQGRDWHASMQDLPEPLMRIIEATLRGHEDETLASLGDLELVRP
jgi:hypothetical protein